MVRRTEKFYSELWWDLAWTKFTNNLYRLQRRVYAAIRPLYSNGTILVGGVGNLRYDF